MKLTKEEYKEIQKQSQWLQIPSYNFEAKIFVNGELVALIDTYEDEEISFYKMDLFQPVFKYIKIKELDTQKELNSRNSKRFIKINKLIIIKKYEEIDLLKLENKGK